MLSKLAATFFSQSPVMFYPLAALLLFLLVFLIVSARVIRSNKESYDALASLPLDIETGEGQ